MRVRARTCAAVLAVAAGVLLDQSSPFAGQPAPPAGRSPRNANYVLRAALDPVAHTIAGGGRLTWRNITKNAATELRFHLYWNAWRDTSSSWMREQQLARNGAPLDRPAGDRGSIDLKRLALADGADLLAGARFIAPDGNGEDRTVLAVSLPHPVAPGGTIAIDLAWASHVPRTFARTGRIGDYYFVAQWFPKIGVLEDAGWNCHQFHSATEFFSDFGTYDVTLSVPRYWEVGATGRRTEMRTDAAAARSEHRFVESDVHDFAWTTSPDFVEAHERFAEPGLPTVDMRLLLQPEHGTSDQIARHFNATRIALKYYGTWFGAYPYDHITIVDPVAIVAPEAQGGSTGGMEYPTIFTAGSRLLAPRSALTPEGVTVHEAGHQFWYGVVATNEFEHAWMDEGLNTFSTARAIAEGLPPSFVAVDRYFGGFVPWAYADVPWSRDVDGNRLNAYRPAATADTPATPSWQYWPGSAGAITYNKTALWLATLEKSLGWPMTQKILSTHFARGAFQHPTPDQFFAIANEVSGQDLTWFFDAVYRSSAVFDYGAAQVTTAAAGAAFDSTVVVRRYGDGVFPVEVAVTFADGARATERWDGRGRWHAFAYRQRGKVTRVEVDPRRVLLLDLNYTNNSWTNQPQAAAAAHKWSLRWLTWVEELLLTYAHFS